MILLGTSVSAGIAVGTAYIFAPPKLVIQQYHIAAIEIESSITQYKNALDKSKEQLVALRETTAPHHPDKAEILSAQLAILGDVEVQSEVFSLIQQQLCAPAYAVDTIYENYIAILSALEDGFMRERADDLRDVKERILRVLLGIDDIRLSEIKQPSIIFAQDLLPSDTASLDREMALAIVTENGGATSHSAIIARSYGIPALLGVQDVLKYVTGGEHVIVDAIAGKIFLHPTTEDYAFYLQKKKEHTQRNDDLAPFQKVAPITMDRQYISISLNISSVGDEELAASDFTDGVGLFRSEFLFMAEKSELPSEERQFDAYKKVAETFGERQVILRTLDIGGDKPLKSIPMPVESNPFLGCRALRLCLRKPDLFKTQLRAALRASVYGNLAIMFPMVGSIEDLREAKAYLSEVRRELTEEGIPFSDKIQVGIMIEIPAIALIADLVASEVDFASIGTNDLCQYITAADRHNPDVSAYYQSYHPAMFRMISTVSDAFQKAGKPLSVCGEIAAEPKAVAVLIGLGIRKFSMTASRVAIIKQLVTRLDTQTAHQIADCVLSMKTASEIEAYLAEALTGIGYS